MKKTVSMLLVLMMLAVPALCERYDSAFGYSMELPEMWLPLNGDTYSAIATRLGEEKLQQMGLSEGTIEDVFARVTAAGMEYLFSGDGLSNAIVYVVRQPVTPEELALTAEMTRLGYEQAGMTDAVSGAAKFGENEFQAVVCTVNGVVIASYFCAEGGALYSIVFTNASAEDVSWMLSSAVFSTGTEDAGGSGEIGETADSAEETPPAGAMFLMNGALKEPRG